MNWGLPLIRDPREVGGSGTSGGPRLQVWVSIWSVEACSRGPQHVSGPRSVPDSFHWMMPIIGSARSYPWLVNLLGKKLWMISSAVCGRMEDAAGTLELRAASPIMVVSAVLINTKPLISHVELQDRPRKLINLASLTRSFTST